MEMVFHAAIAIYFVIRYHFRTPHKVKMRYPMNEVNSNGGIFTLNAQRGFIHLSRAVPQCFLFGGAINTLINFCFLVSPVRWTTESPPIF